MHDVRASVIYGELRMDVACPKCQTEYELEDHRVPDEGVAVKCSTCGHVFRAQKPAPGTAARKASRSSDLPPAPPPREWKLRQPSGAVSACRELTALQRWIVEGKVSRDDEISLTGETWKRLGDIPELSSFFRVVDEAARARKYEALQQPGMHTVPETPAIMGLAALVPPSDAPSVSARPTPPMGQDYSRAAGLTGAPEATLPPSSEAWLGPTAAPPSAELGSSALPPGPRSVSSTSPALRPSGPPTLPPMPRSSGAYAAVPIAGAPPFPGGPGQAPISFEMSPLAVPLPVPRASATAGGVSSSGGAAVPRTSGVFPAPPGLPTPTGWSSGVAPSLAGYGGASNSPAPTSSLEPPHLGARPPATGGSDLSPGAAPLAPAMVTSSESPPASVAPGRRPTDPEFARVQPGPPGPGPLIGATAPSVEAVDALSARRTLRGPEFSAVLQPEGRAGRHDAELTFWRRVSAGVLLVLGLGTLAAGAWVLVEQGLLAGVLPGRVELPGVVAPPEPTMSSSSQVLAPAGGGVVASDESDAGEVKALEATGGPDAGGSPAAGVQEDSGVPEPDGGATEVVPDPVPQVNDLAPLPRDRGGRGAAPLEVPATVVEHDGGARRPEAKESEQRFDELLDRADRLRARDRPEAALDFYGRAHELQPDRVEPVAGRGLSLLDLENYPAARSAFLRALKLDARYGPAIMGLAETYRLQGNGPKAMEYYRRYLEVLPDGDEASVARNNIQRLKP